MEKKTKEQELEKANQNVLKKIEETDNKIKSFMELRGFTKDTFNHYWQIINNDIALERISLVYAGDLYELGRTQAISEFKEKSKKKLSIIDFWQEENIWTAINRELEKTAQEITG
jgi:hypothetical protein